MEVNFIRERLDLKDLKRFKLSDRTFDRQFCNIYLARLAALKPALSAKVTEKWKGIDVISLVDLSARSTEEPCAIVGVLYKHQEFKPSILHELSNELQVTPQPARANYASFKDTLFLEDEFLRVKLIGDSLIIQRVVTGLVCAVLGYPNEYGALRVTDYCFPGRCPRPLTASQNATGKVLLVSGLNFSNTAQSLSLNLLAEWLNGMAGDEETQKEQATIVCAIIAGNSVRGSVETHTHKGYFSTKAHDEAIFKESAHSIHRLDSFLSSIVQSCPVILMPGEFDPSSHCLPQQPFHPCILPNSSKYNSLRCVTNPWIGQIGSRLIAGTSGQPVTDILKVSGLQSLSPIFWLDQTLDWRHYAPTAPDTVPAYPYFDADPFIMQECPDVYFAGNMEQFETKLSKGEDGATRLICVPSFCTTQTAVLLDLKDLNCWTVSFG